MSLSQHAHSPKHCVQSYQRSMPVDVHYGSYISPAEYDVMLTDIKEEDVIDVSCELGQRHHSQAQAAAEFPISGVFRGEHDACSTAVA